VFTVTVIGMYLYRIVSVKTTIVANINYRSLHKLPTPTGGGIVFAMTFITSLIILWWLDQLSDDLFLVLGVGGAVATVFGFLDDRFQISVKYKLVVQFLLSCWVLFWFNSGPLVSIDWLPSLIAILITLLLLVWIINAYNFMDGIDGMAASGAIFVSGSISIVLLVTNSSSPILILSTSLLACASAFIIFNWPPASIFMGDAGSIFLGYIFGSQIIYTTMNNEVSIYTWLIVFSYFIADTTATQISRIILLKKWNKAHRSHAYQNIARISNSHFKVTVGNVLYSIFWLFPLLIWSIVDPAMAGISSIASLLPAFIMSFKYGPFLSAD